MSMLGFCQWLESTPVSIALHESIWGYPIVESVHVLALCLFLGLTVMLDLRLMGVPPRGCPSVRGRHTAPALDYGWLRVDGCLRITAVLRRPGEGIREYCLLLECWDPRS